MLRSPLAIATAARSVARSQRSSPATRRLIIAGAAPHRSYSPLHSVAPAQRTSGCFSARMATASSTSRSASTQAGPPIKVRQPIPRPPEVIPNRALTVGPACGAACEPELVGRQGRIHQRQMDCREQRRLVRGHQSVLHLFFFSSSSSSLSPIGSAFFIWLTWVPVQTQELARSSGLCPR